MILLPGLVDLGLYCKNNYGSKTLRLRNKNFQQYFFFEYSDTALWATNPGNTSSSWFSRKSPSYSIIYTNNFKLKKNFASEWFYWLLLLIISHKVLVNNRSCYNIYSLLLKFFFSWTIIFINNNFNLIIDLLMKP